jgi:carbon monoxide dehydrogenase subunit G
MSIGLVALAGVAAVIVIVLVLAALKPDSFRIERSARIAATPEAIHPFIADFHKWQAWSPFEKLDNNIERDYLGAPSGKGAIYTWDGKKAGAGRMKVLESAPPKTTIQLDFIRPFVAHNTAEFTLVPSGGATVVTWAMFGPSTFVSKLMNVFMSSDKMVGGMFEEGLNSLKTVSEH